MKCSIFVVTVLGAVALSSSSFAQEPLIEPVLVPKGHTGFQLALRPGLAIPFGDGAKDVAMSDVLSPQIPLLIDIGGKVIPELFLGAYFGAAGGVTAGTRKDLCEANGGGCAVGRLNFGIEVVGHMMPRSQVDPWVGYGFGYEILGVGESTNGLIKGVGYGGLEFGRLMAGVDFRLTRVFGVGPFADLAIGQYSTVSVDGNSADVASEKKAAHLWLTIGARFVFFP
jgi:hypothetical protein